MIEPMLCMSNLLGFSVRPWAVSVSARCQRLRHGHIMLETVFGPTITLSTGRMIPTRYVGEQHVQQDLGFIPSFADWMRAIRPLPWMGRSGRIDDRPQS